MQNKAQSKSCSPHRPGTASLKGCLLSDGLPRECSQAHLDSKHICLACRVLLLVTTGLHMLSQGQAPGTCLTSRCSQVKAMAEAKHTRRGQHWGPCHES